ncbi:hypothetical protein SELMODRAFT_121390 [Selaginella moellendorffii]|uniref:Pentacotripeptide-repeat region of PRORP domain-containing protein n=2 Tax=Selaginella moellendorffii TaxID=88036 RepID=D8SNQ1_SELML|nr:hypothetical protein SELMODRAFT_121390 [Selaginella moellendorffii]
MPERDLVSWTGLLQINCQYGNVEFVKQVFDSMPERDTVSWNIMGAAQSQRRSYTQSIQLLRTMTMEGADVSQRSVLSVLAASNDVGLLEQARHLFLLMAGDHGIAPAMEHFCSVVCLLGRAGRVEMAQELLDTMPFIPDSVAWAALFAAHRIHSSSFLGH